MRGDVRDGGTEAMTKTKTEATSYDAGLGEGGKGGLEASMGAMAAPREWLGACRDRSRRSEMARERHEQGRDHPQTPGATVWLMGTSVVA